jgi:hypothetical protein
MNKLFVNCGWHPYKYELDFQYEKDIEVYVDYMPTTIIPQNTIRIIVIQEPNNDLKQRYIKYFNENKNSYNYIFTYHQDILEEFSNSKLFIGSCTRIHYYKFPIKNFSVSTLVGGKTSNEYEGYVLRHGLWFNQNRIKIPKNFYLSSQCKLNGVDYNKNYVIYEEKDPLFNSQFSITIENTSIRNMFSEKLIDCFQTKTIPIYYGCKNVGDFFNVDGMFIVNSLDDIINVCNSLTPEIYETKLSSIEDNYMKSIEFSLFDVNLKNKIIELLNEIK